MKEAKARHDNLQGSRTKTPVWSLLTEPTRLRCLQARAVSQRLAVALGSLLPSLPTSEA